LEEEFWEVSRKEVRVREGWRRLRRSEEVSDAGADPQVGGKVTIRAT